MTEIDEVDWREAFIKYVNIVAECEGVTFLAESDWGADWPVIRELGDEAYRRWVFPGTPRHEGSGS